MTDHVDRKRRTGKIPIDQYQTVRELISEGKTANQISDIYQVNPETIRKFARRRKLKIQKQDLTGDNHPNWRGGTTLDRSGYILQRVDLDGEFGYLIRAIQKRGKRGTDSAGYAPVHRIVMHQKLGRRLRPGEVVDHIDGDIQNNHYDNLRVFESNAEHLRVTLKGKVPNWTPEGFARMTGRPKKIQAPDP